MSFAKNGVDLGVAFEDDFKSKKLFPAFALYQKGDRLTIDNCNIPRFSSSHGKPGSVDEEMVDSVTLSALQYHRAFAMFSFPASMVVADGK